jgi:hypothetical protein
MKYLKLSFIILASVYLTFLIRNIVLHETYKHLTIEEEIVFKRVTDSKWKFEIETHYNSYDELHITEYALDSDSSGVVNYRRFKRKILGVDRAHLYSWASLLPYDKDKPLEVVSSRFEINDSAILHIGPLPPFRNDSVIANYEIRNGDLVIISYIDSKDPIEYKSGIPFFQSSPISFAMLIPVFSRLVINIKQGNLHGLLR